jgi:hypothetical protein
MRPGRDGGERDSAPSAQLPLQCEREAAEAQAAASLMGVSGLWQKVLCSSSFERTFEEHVENCV